MKSQLRRYTFFLLLLLLSAGWVFLMSLDMGGDGAGAAATDGVQATITWIDWKGAGFPQVEAHISVLDSAGEPVRGLTQDVFSLREDDIDVTIDSFLGSGEQTVITMLVIDRSDSMDREKMTGAKNAATTFVDQMRPERDQAGLITFNDRVDQVQTLTNDVNTLRQAIDRIQTDGGTAFYDGVYQGLLDLQGTTGRRIVLALTDGLDNASSHTPEQIIQLAQAEGIAIYTIGLGEERVIFSGLDGETLRLIAAETGGEYHATPSASELAALYKRIAEVVQNEYVLIYDSPSPNLDGTTRQVEVVINRETGSITTSGKYAVSGVISSAFNAALFIPLFVGLLLLLLLLLLVPMGLQRWQRRLMAQAAAAPTPFPYPIYPPPMPPAPSVPPPATPQGTQAIPGNFSCPHCNKPVLAGKKFCAHCGKPISAPAPPSAAPVALTCRHCGQALRPGMKFCNRCGKAQ